jgi:hypothetical protein
MRGGKNVSVKLRDWLQSNVVLFLLFYLLLLFHNEVYFLTTRALTSARKLSLSDFPAFNLKTRNIGYKASKAIRINNLVL